MALKFKDFLNVDYAPGMPDEVKLNAKKRKGGTTGGTDAEYEALDVAARLKKSRTMKKYKSRLALGRKKAMKRTASRDVLQRRARKQARADVLAKITRDVPKSELSNARKKELEARLDRPAMKSRINRIAKKLLPAMKKREMQRRRGK